MLVRELMEKLSKLDPDAPVLIYNERCEDDYIITDANEVYPEEETWDGETIYDAPYYCQGIGIAREYFRLNDGKFPVVLLETSE